MGTIEPMELLMRLGVAALCAGIIGLERELRGKPAGLRTVMLVGIGTAVFALIGAEVARAEPSFGYQATGDLGRVLQGVIAGVGMLGAGVFLHRAETISLATTGASVWLAGGLGIASGLGLYLLAGSATILALVVLEGLGALHRYLDRA